MPVLQTAANIWFYQDFLANGQTVDLWQNRPEDWNRLQILDGDTMCNRLMKNHNGMVQSMVNTDTFQAFTEDASMDMLKHFIMSDRARNLYQAMKTIASNRAMQQEQEMKPDVPQKQDASKMIGMS